MVPTKGRNVWNTLSLITLAVAFMNKIIITFQILMNVPLIPATPLPFAPTLTDRSHASVDPDSLETD